VTRSSKRKAMHDAGSGSGTGPEGTADGKGGRRIVMAAA
jgi:hypothetical protein